MRGFYKVYMLSVFGLIISLGLCSACTLNERAAIPQTGKTIAYKIISDEKTEAALMDAVTEAKAQRFHIVYRNGDRMFLAVGYGEQPSSGYSITVEDIYEKDGVVYVCTMLVGPQKNEKTSSVRTFPYIILEMENMDCEIVFR